MAFVKVTKIKDVLDTASATVTATAGNLLICLASNYYAGAASVKTLTVTGGGSWTTNGTDNQHLSSTNDNLQNGVAICASATGGSATVTVTLTGSSGLTAIIYEFSSMDPSPFEALGTGIQGSASPVNSPLLSNSNATDVMVAIASTRSSGAETHGSPSNSWTMPAGADETDGTAAVTIVTAYKIVSASASQSTSWTDSPSVPWASLIGAYIQAGGTTPLPPGLGPDVGMSVPVMGAQGAMAR